MGDGQGEGGGAALGTTRVLQALQDSYTVRTNWLLQALQDSYTVKINLTKSTLTD